MVVKAKSRQTYSSFKHSKFNFFIFMLLKSIRKSPSMDQFFAVHFNNTTRIVGKGGDVIEDMPQVNLPVFGPPFPLREKNVCLVIWCGLWYVCGGCFSEHRFFFHFKKVNTLEMSNIRQKGIYIQHSQNCYCDRQSCVNRFYI